MEITVYRENPPPYRRASRAVLVSSPGEKTPERLAFDTLEPGHAMRADTGSHERAQSASYRLRRAARKNGWVVRVTIEGPVLTLWRFS